LAGLGDSADEGVGLADGVGAGAAAVDDVHPARAGLAVDGGVRVTGRDVRVAVTVEVRLRPRLARGRGRVHLRADAEPARQLALLQLELLQPPLVDSDLVDLSLPVLAPVRTPYLEGTGGGPQVRRVGLGDLAGRDITVVGPAVHPDPDLPRRRVVDPG